MSALFNTETLANWYHRKDSEQLVNDAIEAIPLLLKQLFFEQEDLLANQANSREQDPRLNTQSEFQFGDSEMSLFLRDDTYEKEVHDSATRHVDIQTEIRAFVELLMEKKYLNRTTGSFWCFHSKSLPYLNKLALLMRTIPSSSAFIERHFSICGALCPQRNGNMSADLLVTRAMLKTNMNILNEINQE